MRNGSGVFRPCQRHGKLDGGGGLPGEEPHQGDVEAQQARRGIAVGQPLDLAGRHQVHDQRQLGLLERT